jgi:hypothetical protein
MQAEFIQEERIDGTVVYYTRVDGYYVSDSLSFHRDRAEQYYARIVAERSNTPKQTVLQSHQFAQGSAEPADLTVASAD